MSFGVSSAATAQPTDTATTSGSSLDSTSPRHPAVGAALSSSYDAAASRAAVALRDPAGPATPPTAAECGVALEKSQLYGASARLIAAREQTRICTHANCPVEISSECAQSAGELDAAIPSVTFDVRVRDSHAPDAKVFADGRPVEDWTKGTALRLDPGEHVFHVDLLGHLPITQYVTLVEGHRFETIRVDFGVPPAPVASSRISPVPLRLDIVRYERPVPLIVYPLLGAGTLGVLTFGALGFVGRSEQQSLEETCSPRCTDADKSQLRQLYLAADISLGIGAAALLGAAVLYLGRPERPRPSPAISLSTVPGGGLATITLQRY